MTKWESMRNALLWGLIWAFIFEIASWGQFDPMFIFIFVMGIWSIFILVITVLMDLLGVEWGNEK